MIRSLTIFKISFLFQMPFRSFKSYSLLYSLLARENNLLLKFSNSVSHLFIQPIFTVSLLESKRWALCKGGRSWGRWGAMTKLKLGGNRNNETEESSITCNSDVQGRDFRQLWDSQEWRNETPVYSKKQSNRTQTPAKQRATGGHKWWKFKRQNSKFQILILCLELGTVIQLVPLRPRATRVPANPGKAAFLFSLEVWSHNWDSDALILGWCKSNRRLNG